jgi:hypothetical protein
MSLMEEFRRTTPLIDVGTGLRASLVGCPVAEGDKGVADELNRWMEKVPVNQQQVGLGQWLKGHADGMLTYGKGVSELVPNAGRTELVALVNIDPRSVVFKITDNPLVLLPRQRQRQSLQLLELDAAKIVFSHNGAHVDRPHGVSIYRSCPFVLRALRTIENATAQAWERMGCPPFHINVALDPEMADPQGTLASEILSDLKDAWDSVMGTARELSTGQVADYFTAGDVKAGILGAEGTPLSLTEPFRAFNEQVIAATRLPSWMFGFHWASTERLAGQQAEMAMAALEDDRRCLMPAIERIIDTRQRLAGRKGRYQLKWPPINLHDMLQHAQAEMTGELALRQRVERIRLLWAMGYIDQRKASELTDATLGPIARPLTEPPPIQGSNDALAREAVATAERTGGGTGG